MPDGSVAPIVGCLRDVIDRDVANILPIEIEAALLIHSLVRDAAVFGAPDPVLGQRVVDAVQLEGDGDEATMDSILGVASEQLADYKMPDLLVAVDAFPRNRLGKIDRQALAAILLGGTRR